MSQQSNQTVKVINNNLQPEMLDSGQQLAAAGTPEAVPVDVTLSEDDYQRLVVTGKVSIVRVEATEPPEAVNVQPAAPTRNKPARKAD